MVSCRDCEYEVEYSAAALWKNGVKQELPYGDSPDGLDIRTYSVFVSGNDVYVAGGERNDDIAILWKNGVPQSLEGGKLATSVFVSGENVYVAGFLKSSSFIPLLWRDGVHYHLTDDSGFYDPSVFVLENNVYVAWRNKIWKNENIIYILSGTANSICVFENDIYVAGTENSKATIWKNGVPQTLPGGSKANAVFVSKNDVYVGGDSKVWKNGNVEYSINGSATSIFVLGNDVYVTTEYRVLKNGTVIMESDLRPNATESSYFTSVFVSGNDVYVAGFYYKFIRVCS